MSLAGRRLFGVLVVALAGMPARPARAEKSAAPAPPPAEIVLVGEDAACARVREAVAEALSREGLAATWGRRQDFQPHDIFDRGRAQELVAAWIDLSAPDEARLYFRDASADRFFLRSLALARGIDEIAKEEIAHIVSKAVLALIQGGGEPLTRSEARQALKLVEPTPEAAARDEPSRPLRLAVAAMAGAQLFAADLPVVARGTLALALTRGPRWNRAKGSLGGWLDLGYQFPGRYQGSVVGADVEAASARAGALWEIERSVLLRFGLGAGVDRISYQPRSESATVDLAPGSSFYVPVVCFWAGMDLRLLDWLALTSRISLDVPWAKVHFDLHDKGGQTTQVLVPYRVLPAASVGLAFVL